MVRTLKSAGIYILANAVGLFVASLLLGRDFTFTVKGFLVATLLLTAVEAVTGPLIVRMAKNRFPAMQGGVALVTTFVGLWITTVLVGGMRIQGVSTWLMATVLVWLGALVASILLPKVLVRKAAKTPPGAPRS